MKIAWFGHAASARRNGIVTYSREIVGGLTAREVQVIFFHHATRERNVVTPPNSRTVRVGALDILSRATLSSLRAVRLIRNILTQEAPDVAHVSLSFSNLDSELPDLCHSLGIPIAATMHFPYGPPGTLWSNAMKVMYRLTSNWLPKYDAVIVFSEGQRRMLMEYGVAGDRLRVVPNGVDVDFYAPGEPDYKEELGARVLISYVGRVDPEKNVGTLLGAFDELEFPEDHQLVVVGDGVDLGRLRRKYSRNPQIIFRGYVRDPSERARVFRSTDIFVLPSAIEGLSLAMLEAMASGAAIIATDVGSDGEAIRGAGLVLDLSGLADQLPLALRTLIEYPEFRIRLAHQARQRAVEYYSLSRNLDNLIALYRDLKQNQRYWN